MFMYIGGLFLGMLAHGLFQWRSDPGDEKGHQYD